MKIKMSYGLVVVALLVLSLAACNLLGSGGDGSSEASSAELLSAGIAALTSVGSRALFHPVPA